ncbi:hypothetical protein ACFQ3K_14680 [Brucella gallinifaecis]|uniref:Uncharacterized protein n=1 Tax=Brucella gallinifaecis TaxID=215590 RepID=A0A502BSC3_9HYPH|nr:hypothetical protein [Brucella gallinifaecis]TPF76710.1 hypothetical protein FHY56_04240 [Brucella gallinifaecis]
MKPEPKLLIALESIPHVIGERQFRTLCLALGIEEEIFRHKEYELSGLSREGYFARHVENKAASVVQARVADEIKPSRQPFAGL